MQTLLFKRWGFIFFVFLPIVSVWAKGSDSDAEIPSRTAESYLSQFFSSGLGEKILGELGDREFNSARRVSRAWRAETEKWIRNRQQLVAPIAKGSTEWGLSYDENYFIVSLPKVIANTSSFIELIHLGTGQKDYHTEVRGLASQIVASDQVPVIFGRNDEKQWFKWKYKDQNKHVDYYEVPTQEKVIHQSFSHSGAYLVSVTKSGKVLVLSTEDNTIQREGEISPQKLSSIFISETGNELIVSRFKGVDRRYSDIEFYDLENGFRIIETFRSASNVDRVLFSTSAGSGSPSKKAFLVGAGVSIFALSGSSAKMTCQFFGNAAGVKYAELSQDGAQILTFGGDGRARLWNSETCQWIKDLPRPKNWNHIPIAGYGIKYGDDETQLWNYQSGRLIGTLGLLDGDARVIWNSSQLVLVRKTGDNTTIVILDIQTEKVLYEIPVPGELRKPLIYDKNQNILVGVVENVGVFVWQLPKPHEEQRASLIFQISDVLALSQNILLDPSGKLLLTYCTYGFCLWEVATGRLLVRDHRWVKNAAFLNQSPAVLLVFGGQSNENPLALYNSEGKKVDTEFIGSSPIRSEDVQSVRASSDDHQFIFRMKDSTSSFSNISVYDRAEKKTVKSISQSTYEVQSLHLSVKKKRLIYVTQDGWIKIHAANF
jgi:WD40 repeat protein